MVLNASIKPVSYCMLCSSIHGSFVAVVPAWNHSNKTELCENTKVYVYLELEVENNSAD
jgi:hypothetical protein